MKSKQNYWKHGIITILLVFVLVAQTTLPIVAETLEDNYETVETVEESDTLPYNGGTVEDNQGTVETNSGTITENAGTVETNTGNVESNSGTIQDNQAFVQENGGTVEENHGRVENNTGTIDDNAGEGSVETNTGTVNENHGYVENNEGTIQENITKVIKEEKYDDGETYIVESTGGYVDNNNGTIETNHGIVSKNKGTIETNEQTVYENTGKVNENKGRIDENKGVVVRNNKTVSRNTGTVDKNFGKVDSNAGTVKENNGAVNNYKNGVVATNNGTVNNGDVIVFPGIMITWAEGGIIEVNNGIVNNGGIVKLNKGKVYSDGGIVEDDQGEHYFRVWLGTESIPINDALSFTVDKGFTTYEGFDRWLEKNSVGELTIHLKPGYRFPKTFPTSADGYRGEFLDDRTLKIWVDKMYKWLTNTTLLIPVEAIPAAASTVAQLTYTVDQNSVAERRTASFDLDGGVFNKGTKDEIGGVVKRTYRNGADITFTVTPEKEGYAFLCWEEQLPEDEVIDKETTEETEQEEEEIEETSAEEKDVKETETEAETKGDDVELRRYEIGDRYHVERDVTFKAIWEKVEKDN